MTKTLTRIASSSPGRIRIRDLALRNRSRMEAVEQALQAIEGIHGVTTNAAAGSVVLHYDPTSIAPVELEHRIDAIVDTALAAPGKPGRHTVRRHANRAAKLGMLGRFARTRGGREQALACGDGWRVRRLCRRACGPASQGRLSLIGAARGRRPPV